MNTTINYANMYAVLYEEKTHPTGEETLVFFETKEEVDQLISKLHQMRTFTNQRLSYFSFVFEKGAVLPTTYEGFWKEKRNKNRKQFRVGAGYFVQRTLKSGKIKSKTYNFAEDFDWQLSEWEEKGSTNIIILDLDEAHQGDYYYERDIQKVWGDKDEPLLA